jgi:tetratricopeptide (TPR) repeat protein
MQVLGDSGRKKTIPVTILVVWALLLSMAILTAAQGANIAEPEAFKAQLKTALALHVRGDYAHSIPMLERLVQASPRNYSANLLLGEDLFLSGKPRDALSWLQVAAEVRPDDVTALDYEAAAAESLGDFATESEALETAVARSREDEKHLLAWGNFCLRRFEAVQTVMLGTKQGKAAELRLSAWGQPQGSEAGESLLEKSAALDPEQRGIWGELGIAQLELGNQAQAQTTLKEAEQRDPQAADTLQLEALLAAAAQDWQVAEKRLLSLGEQSSAELNKALAAWPRILIPGPEMTGAIWSCLRNPTDSCPAVSPAPENGEGLSASELFLEGRWEALATLPSPATASQSEWTWRGVALAREGDCPKAMPALERGWTATEREGALYLQFCYENEESRAEDRLTAQGKAGAFHELRGDLEMIVGNDPAAAEKDYAAALKSRPHDARLLAKSAEACLMTDGPADPTRARTAALSALAINPHETEAVQTLAEIALYQRNYAEAVVRLRQLAAAQPANAWSKVELGVAYGQLGQPGEAVRYLEPLLKAGYPDPKGQLHGQLAVALRKLGRTEEAGLVAAEASRLANVYLKNGAREGTDAP